MDKVFLKMSEIVDKFVQNYKTDFTVHDTQTYGRMYDGTQFIWIVRPSGTWVCGIPSVIKKSWNVQGWETVDPRLVKPNFTNMTFGEYLKEIESYSKDIVSAYDEPKNRFYLVTKGKDIKQISKQQALEIIKDV